MKIGNNIHTTSIKKAYRKPVLEVVEIDRVILLAAGNSGDEPIGDPPNMVQGFSETDNNTINSSPPSKDTNPFGGSTPEYQR